MSEQARSPERIEDEIRATQHRIDKEIEAIQARFQPAALLSRLIGEDGNSRQGSDNNGPFAPASLRAALIGAGISWLAQTAFATVNSPEVRKTARGAATRAKKTAKEASQAGTETGEAALEAISDAADQVRQSGLRGLEWVKNNPIPSSLAGFAAGAAIAAVVSAALEENDGGSGNSGKPAAKKSVKGNGKAKKTTARKTAARKTAKRARKTARAGKTTSSAKSDQRRAS